jgi:hypothetical protein
MKKTIIALFVLSLFLFASAENLYACSCVSFTESVKKQVKRAFSDSTAIFEGEVLEVSKSSKNEFELIIKLKVSKSWKGIQTGEITVKTPNQGSMCGYDFAVGKSYLIYANGSDNQLSVFLCSRTADLLNNGDIKFLNNLKPKKTVKKQTAKNDPNSK